MKASNVESYADVGGIASPDINLKVLLRRMVIPEFFEDVKYPSWRRVPASLPVQQGVKAYDLPDDFGQMIQVVLGIEQPVKYIGEDPDKVLAAELATQPGKPSGYYLCRREDSEVFKRLSFDCPPGQNYPNCKILYYRQANFEDDTADVDLDKFIPSQFQWALVERLKAEIMAVRFGLGDPRYTAAMESYARWVMRATENPELARRNHAVFVR